MNQQLTFVAFASLCRIILVFKVQSGAQTVIDTNPALKEIHKVFKL